LILSITSNCIYASSLFQSANPSSTFVIPCASNHSFNPIPSGLSTGSDIIASPLLSTSILYGPSVADDSGESVNPCFLKSSCLLLSISAFLASMPV